MWYHQVRREQRHGWREGLHLQSICLYRRKIDTEQNRKPAVSLMWGLTAGREQRDFTLYTHLKQKPSKTGNMVMLFQGRQSD